MFKVTDLKVTIKTWFRQKPQEILTWVNLHIEKGQIHAFLWTNGSWKTTTLQAILGFIKSKYWTITRLQENTIIGYAPDNTHFYEDLTWLQHIHLLGKFGKKTATFTLENANQLIQKLGLEKAKHQKVKNYSLGMKKRLWLTISLLHNPDFIVWDEPMNGLDPLGRSLVKQIISELKQEGKTVLFSTHILSDVQDLATHFAILHQGKIAKSWDINSLANTLEQEFLNIVS